MEKIIEFNNLSNYKSMTQFYLGWLDFIKNSLDKDNFNPKDFEINSDMNNYENILKSIFLNISMKLIALEEDQIKFEKAHNNDSKREEYDNLKKYFLSPTTYHHNNPLIEETVIEYLNEIYGEEWHLDDTIREEVLYEEGIDYFDLQKEAYFLSKEYYKIKIPRIFEKINVYPGMSGTSGDKFYQLRNCLAHREFSFGIGGYVTDGQDIELGLSSLVIKFDNGKIYGEMTLTELLEAIKIYETFSLLFSDKRYEILSYDYLEGKKTNTKFSYQFNKYTEEHSDELDLEPLVFAKDEEDYPGVESLVDYYQNSELASILFNSGYPLISSEEETISSDENNLIERIKKYYASIVEEKYREEYSILTAEDEIINKYYKSTKNNLCTLNYQDRIMFFRKFFGNKIFLLFPQYKEFASPLHYYKSDDYRKFEPCYDENNKNRLLGLNDVACAPIIYGEFLLEYLFFNFNFVKETNTKESQKGTSIFRYKNINLDNIDLYYYDANENIISTNPYEIKDEKNIAITNKTLAEKEITQLIETIFAIINNNDLIIRDESKRKNKLTEMKELLSIINRKYDINSFIKIIATNLAENNGLDSGNVESLLIKMFSTEYNSSQFTKEEKDIKKILFKIELPKYKSKTYDLSRFDERLIGYNEILNKDDDETIYRDCSKFIAHFRNAITHGNVTINYLDAFLEDGSFDYDNIKFDFCDICPQTGKKVFEIKEITSKKLLEILEEYTFIVVNTDNQEFIKEYNRNEDIKKLVKQLFSNIGDKIDIII